MDKTHSFLKTLMIALASLLASTSLIAQERLISAGSAVTELVDALGASSQLVAVDVTSAQPEGKRLPVIGYHRQLSAEGLLALSPNMLIGSEEMGPKTTLTLLKNAGVKVEVVNTSPTVDGLLERIDEVASITHTNEKAGALKQTVQEKIESIQNNHPVKAEQKRVLFLLIHEGRPANVAGSETTPDALITLAGALNPVAQSVKSYKPLSTESLVEMQPDVILVSGRSWEKLGGADAILKSMPLLAATPAGKNKAFVTIDGQALVGGLGLKTLEEAQRVNKILYAPEKN
ncbi:heme/hemin ABC transporter substrate-binding protein [Vibrio penaeicida]|uniref:Hemin ABC transporter substrate-binding protein n=1 Tax=Vibrio penaeicida TaxID=104609 RepID=A0AAV5NMY7_9VIBR|nr:hemin ABC transporter substrate-binding protein [Vibrio penaeicida]RTZ24479.1 hemin ABC transporter substrate-binding protein [Vibrio penaeicida]GLQ71748.1 hemin ABC transporter substrate-binding protein [Vibrio penaeicida]